MAKFDPEEFYRKYIELLHKEGVPKAILEWRRRLLFRRLTDEELEVLLTAAEEWFKDASKVWKETDAHWQELWQERSTRNWVAWLREEEEKGTLEEFLNKWEKMSGYERHELATKRYYEKNPVKSLGLRREDDA